MHLATTLRSIGYASALLFGGVVACGGRAAPPAATQANRPAELERVGGEAGAGDDGYDGDGDGGDGGDGYGGDGYGGDPPAAPPPVVPADPPELGDYLPTQRAAPSAQQDPAAVYAVPIDDSPSAGAADAAVTLVVTYEFADPFSDRLRATLAELRTKYGPDLRVVWKSFIVHRKAQAAALVGCAAAKQGKFEPYLNAMLAAAVGPGGDYRTDLEAVDQVVGGLGLDPMRLDDDLHSQACKDAIIRDQQLFERLGQQAVPVSYINGRVLQGAQPAASFAVVIDEELAKAKAAFKRGTKPAKYYAGLVKTGRTTP
jgi:protein-disulfide isomerase